MSLKVGSGWSTGYGRDATIPAVDHALPVPSPNASECSAVSDLKNKIGGVLRFVASQGWADEDAEVVSELLERAGTLAELVLADPSASPAARSAAEDLLERLRSDTYGRA